MDMELNLEDVNKTITCEMYFYELDIRGPNGVVFPKADLKLDN